LEKNLEFELGLLATTKREHGVQALTKKMEKEHGVQALACFS
jgi:hypothetical protein